MINLHPHPIPFRFRFLQASIWPECNSAGSPKSCWFCVYSSITLDSEPLIAPLWLPHTTHLQEIHTSCEVKLTGTKGIRLCVAPNSHISEVLQQLLPGSAVSRCETVLQCTPLPVSSASFSVPSQSRQMAEGFDALVGSLGNCGVDVASDSRSL